MLSRCLQLKPEAILVGLSHHESMVGADSQVTESEDVRLQVDVSPMGMAKDTDFLLAQATDAADAKELPVTRTLSKRSRAAQVKRAEQHAPSLPSGKNLDVLRLTTHIRPELLRGASVSSLCSSLGKYVRFTPGDLDKITLAANFEKSKACERVDNFISHVWAGSGVRKYLAMLFHFVGYEALAFGLSVAVFVYVCLHWDGPLAHIPYTGTTHWVGGYASNFSPCCMLAGQAACMIGYVVSPYFHTRRKNFFDFMCVHQSDEELKQAAVHAFGGILRKSKNLLILWDSDYFRRLWTSYELAAFGAIHGTDCKVKLVPVGLASGLVIMQMLMFVNDIILMMSKAYFYGPVKVQVGLLLVGFVPYHFLVGTARRYARDCRRLLHDIEEFDVNTVKCSIESDRLDVMHDINGMYGSESKFNAYVRSSFPKRIEQFYPTSLSAISYEHAFFCISPCVFFLLDFSVLDWDCETPEVIKRVWNIMSILWVFTIEPLRMAFVFTLGTCCAERAARCPDVVYQSGLVCLCLFVSILLSVGALKAVRAAPNHGLMPILIVGLVYVLITVVVFARPSKNQRDDIV